MSNIDVREHDMVAALLRRAGRVLLCHRTPDRRWFPDVWDFPGGHIEADELAEDALVREIREEVSVANIQLDEARQLRLADAGYVDIIERALRPG